MKTSHQYLLAGVVFVAGAAGLYVFMSGTTPPPTVMSVGARALDDTAIEVDDVSAATNRITHTRFAVADGKQLAQTTDTAPAPDPYPQAPLCGTQRSVARPGKPTLRTAPHFGDPDYTPGGESPPNTITIDPVLQPLGFLGVPTPWLLGDDTLLLYDHGAGIARLDATGKQVWLAALGGTCEVALRTADDTLVLATSEPKRRLVNLDLKTGAIRWTRASVPAAR